MACAEQVAMCVPEQINIWLTLHSGYYLTEISEQEVGGLDGFWIPSFHPLSFSLQLHRYHWLQCNTFPMPEKTLKVSRNLG